MSIGIFAENVKHLRENDRLKLNEMQSYLGFPRSTWNGYERGTSFPNFKDLMKISEYFGVLESDLLHTYLPESDLKAVCDRFIAARPAVTPQSTSFINYISGKKMQIGGGLNVVNDHPKDHPTDHPTHKLVDFKASDNNSNSSVLGADYGTKTPKIITINEQGVDNILYVPVKARAGYLLGHGDTEFMESLPTFRMPGLNNATYRMFETEGLSMSPTLSDRDRVIGEWVDNFDNIRENRVHVVITKTGVVIKRVLNRLKERGKLYLKSDTITHRQDYPIIEIDPSEIIEIWYVNLKLSSDLSEPSEIYERVSDLEINQREIMRKLGLATK